MENSRVGRIRCKISNANNYLPQGIYYKYCLIYRIFGGEPLSSEDVADLIPRDEEALAA